MAEESLVADYFVVAGLPDDPKPMDDYTDGSHLKQNHNLAPITDVTVIFPTLGEVCPEGWQVLQYTPTGLLADLNFGSLNSPEVYICYKRGRHKPPLVDIGVLYENKDRILSDSEIVLKTPYNRIANVNNANTRTFLTYRRAKKDMPANELVVTNICVIITSKGEKPPHAFCVIKKNLNKGVFAQDVFLCYKKSMNRANLISYKPGILCRYPTWDRPDWKLHSNVPLFCLPMGATLEVWPPEASQPAAEFSTFVLTVSDAAEKVYGSAITFYERYPIEKLTEEQISVLEKSLESERASNSELSLASSEKSLDSSEASPNDNLSEENSSSTSRRSIISGSHTFNVNKCICLLSHWPFFDTFEKFLSFLYKLSTTGPHTVPIERYISHFLENVPFPSPQRPRILVQLSARERVVLYQPEDIPLPRSGAGFRELLKNLGSEDTLLVLLLVLTEHKILVHSLRPNVLTSVVEALSMIMFPFKWQCPYIPLCPLGLAEVLHAPVPFLIGVNSRFFDMYDPPPDVTCIDLDTNNITVSEERKNLSYKLLPKRAARHLKNTLDDLCKKCIMSDHAMQNSRSEDDDCVDDMIRFQMKDKEQKMELEIQEAFLRFMAIILKGYRSYLLPIVRAPTVGTTDPNSLFDLQGFLKSRDRAHHKFFVMLMKTQMFIRFIEERSFVSDMDVGLAFFDECTEKVDSDDGNFRLLDLDDSLKSERTVFIPPPEPSGLPAGVTYKYQTFNLDGNLFKNKDTKVTLQVPSQENAPGSPMARRTKHEVKSAQKLARRKHSQSAQSWAKCLLTTCYSLWFIHLPSFVINDSSKASARLRVAYDLLVKIQKLKLHPTDEVCYRVMMQLFGVHSQPVLAVNLLSQMKKCGIQPNALTYGYYNRAVLEANWPSDQSYPSQLWSKLRNVIVGAALLRRGAQRAKNRLPEAESCTSIASLDKGDMVSEFEKFVKKRSSVLGSIMKPTQQNLQELVSHRKLENSAGILMTGFQKSPTLTRRRSCSDFTARLPQTNSSVSTDVSASRLRRGSMTPSASGSDPLKMLLGSDTFANDSSILEKHNRTKKVTAENNQSSTGNLKTLSVPRESSESLDITDELSQDESWSSRRNSDRLENGKNWSKLGKHPHGFNCFDSKVWETDGGLESIGSAESLYQLHLDEVGVDGKPRKADGCVESVGSSESLAQIKPEENFVGEDAMKTSSSKAQSEKDNCEENEKSGAGLKSNGGFNLSKCNNVSPSSKTSPIRTPVTENDPLGALQSTEPSVNGSVEEAEVNGAENVRDHEPSSRMKFDLSVGGLFSSHLGRTPRRDGDGHGKTRRKEGGQGDGVPGMGGRVPKSATFHNGREKPIDSGRTAPRESTPPLEETECNRKSMQRSSTLPDAVAAAAAAISSSPSVASSLSHFSSNFKFSLSRYSPSRFSLKKSDLRIAKTQILENAISGSKKSNELLLSGFNTVKSAASSVAKKIEEVISTNTTPVKSHNASREFEEEDTDYGVEKTAALDFELWGTNLKEFFGDGSRKGSSANLQAQCPEEQEPYPEDAIVESLYGKTAIARNIESPPALVIAMTTCCKCHSCCSVLHDEEIIAGWTPDDSNLNTVCHFCGKPTLPFLSVTIYDYRGRDKKAASSREGLNLSQSLPSVHDEVNDGSNSKKPEEDVAVAAEETPADKKTADDVKGANNSFEPHVLEPINVAYLNPLVLRKELENILNHEGDLSLTKPSFVDQHPIVYWNIVSSYTKIWMFERINVTSHLHGLALESSAVNKNQFIHDSWRSKCDSSNVSIKCLWDNPRIYEEMGQPMYVLWQQQEHHSPLVSALVTDRMSMPKSVMQNIIACLRRDNLYDSMCLLLSERTKLRHTYSLYRDILFLAITACGRDNIILDSFDREYTHSYKQLKAEGVALLDCDKPPVSASYRNYFRPLLLSHQPKSYV